MRLPDIPLDDRRFQDLVDEARVRIARSCPEWTEHNVSDPGITLIELFAWMTDMLVFRINRLPEKVHIALLELLGIRMAPPEAASTLVRFRLAAPARQRLPIPGGRTEVATLRATDEEPVVFQVTDDFTIPPLRPDAYLLERGGVLRDVQLADGQARPQGADQLPFATPPRPGDALYLGFEEPLGRLMVQVSVDASPARGAGVVPADPPLRWEVARTADRWIGVEVLSDTTGGFNYGSGTIELQMPRRSTVIPVGGRRLYWLRCRVDSRTRSGREGAMYTAPPEIYAITASAIGATLPASHSAVSAMEELGTSDGTPGQSFPLRNAPALPLRPGAETLEVREPGGDWVAWEARESFASSLRGDRHFVFDPAAGLVELGPAIREPHGGWVQHGAVPPRGATLRMRAYRHGGGRRGNVAAGALTVPRSAIPGVATVTNPQPARGGVDAEGLDLARRRAALELRTRYRAVTAEDFEFLCGEASSQVARARCLIPAPGAPIAVHVLPAADAGERQMSLDELTAGPELKALVKAYLEERCLIGATVYVAPAALRGASVVVNVECEPLGDPGRVQRDVARALYRYVNPLIGGSPRGRGDGWPFGRALTVGELHGVVQSVPGVEAILMLHVFETDLASGRRAAQPAVGSLEIAPSELLASGAHVVKVVRRAR